MNFGRNDITVRPALPKDTLQLRQLLNDIILVGGTTAIEGPLSSCEFETYFLRGENHICCIVAEDKTGQLTGFQSMEHHSELPDDWADIATFVLQKPTISGVGTALFPHSKIHAKNTGIVAINATIRADNKGGIAYYEKMGFRTYATAKDVPLKDGSLVDRISKRLLLG